MNLQIEVDAAQTITLIETLRADLAALKDIPQFPLDEFLRLGDGLISDLSVGSSCLAADTGDGRIVVQVVGMLEVFAAAIAALKLYVHAVLPQRL